MNLEEALKSASPPDGTGGETVYTRNEELEVPEATITNGILDSNKGVDLPGYHITTAGFCLDRVYRDHLHANNGIHLNGGILDDRLWQRRLGHVV